MEKIGIIAAALFSVLGVVLIVRSYFPVVQEIYERRKNHINSDLPSFKEKVNEELDVLGSASSSKEKAAAFVSLMSISYVLVHTIVNKGNCYDDEIQSRKFRDSLTPELLQRLMGLEGKYE